MNRKSVFEIGVTMAATLLAAAVAQSAIVGVNSAVRNRVTIKAAGDASFKPALVKQRVSLGDDVVTGAASVLQILLLDKTTFTVGANARVRIDRFVYDPARGASAVGASVAKGAFRFMSGKATRGMPGQSAVTTPVGSIGIRGTIFEGAVGADAVRIARAEAGVGKSVRADMTSATLVVLRGPGAGTKGDERPGAIDFTAGGATVSASGSGQALFVPGPGQRPIGPFALSDAGLDALHALLRTAPTRRGGSANINVESSPIVDMIFECESGGESYFQNSSSSSSSGGCRIESQSSDPARP